MVSVSLASFWVSAAGYAKRTDLPLHLIVHDDFPNDPTLTSFERHWANRSLGSGIPQRVLDCAFLPTCQMNMGSVMEPKGMFYTRLVPRTPRRSNSHGRLAALQPYNGSFDSSIDLRNAGAPRMANTLQKNPVAFVGI